MNINSIMKTIENPPSELEPVKQMFPENTQQQIMEQMFRFIELEHLYESAIREVKTKLEILDSEFRTKFSYNPIHHIEDRLKSPQSIMEKLRRQGVPFNVDAARTNLNDIAGVRVICNYIEDIYTVADLLTAQDDVKLVSRKDYIKDPKPNGYRSLHLVIETPVYLSDIKVQVHGELKYKTDTEVSADLAAQLKECAETIAATDVKMQQIYKTLKEIN